MLDLVGNTPMLRMCNIAGGCVFGKAEFLNPAGSVKDRVAKYIIEQAERSGALKPGATIVEATSGNTGIAVAFVAQLKGHKCIICMPSDMSEERKKIIRALGAELVETSAEGSITGACEKAESIHSQIDGSFLVSQFTNPLNPEIHYLTTAHEIWDQMEGDIDAFVAGVGSGGTLTGVGSPPQGERYEHADRGGRAQELRGAAGSRAGLPRHSGHRRRVHSAGAGRPSH